MLQEKFINKLHFIDGILTKKDVEKISKKIFSTSTYNINKEKWNKYFDQIIFAAPIDTGIAFTEQYLLLMGDKSKEIKEVNYKDVSVQLKESYDLWINDIQFNIVFSKKKLTPIIELLNEIWLDSANGSTPEKYKESDDLNFDETVGAVEEEVPGEIGVYKHTTVTEAVELTEYSNDLKIDLTEDLSVVLNNKAEEIIDRVYNYFIENSIHSFDLEVVNTQSNVKICDSTFGVRNCMTPNLFHRFGGGVFGKKNSTFKFFLILPKVEDFDEPLENVYFFSLNKASDEHGCIYNLMRPFSIEGSGDFAYSDKQFSSWFSKSRLSQTNLSTFLRDIRMKSEDGIFDSKDWVFLKGVYHFFNQILMEAKNELSSLDKQIASSLNSLDEDGNGILDISEETDAIRALLEKHEATIGKVDGAILQKLLRFSRSMNLRRDNLQEIFSRILNSNSVQNRNDIIGILRNEIYTYNLMTVNGLNMITCLINNKMILFYDIYETFDTLGYFNSNWENELKNNLENINNNLESIMYGIAAMNINITVQLRNLRETTMRGFNDLNNVVQTELKSIDSNLKFNNLLNSVQAYQLYSIKKKL